MSVAYQDECSYKHFVIYAVLSSVPAYVLRNVRSVEGVVNYKQTSFQSRTDQLQQRIQSTYKITMQTIYSNPLKLLNSFAVFISHM